MLNYQRVNIHLLICHRIFWCLFWHITGAEWPAPPKLGRSDRVSTPGKTSGYSNVATILILLVVWTCLEPWNFMTFHILGMSSSQLTHIFQSRAKNHQPAMIYPSKTSMKFVFHVWSPEGDLHRISQANAWCALRWCEKGASRSSHWLQGLPREDHAVIWQTLAGVLFKFFHFL